MDTRTKTVAALASVVLLAVGGLAVVDQLGLRGNAGKVTGEKLSANILVIIADDMGVDKIGSYAIDGDPEYRGNAMDLPATPVLDDLAANGARFTDAWANPTCSPTRAAYLTGQHGLRTGVGSVVGFQGQGDLDVNETSIADVLNGAGYTTGLFGKWHLGEGDPPSSWAEGDTWADHVGETVDWVVNPIKLGFTQYSGMMSGALNAGGSTGYTDWYPVRTRRQGKPTASAEHSQDFATMTHVDNAVSWINRQTGRWMATIAFNAPHEPLEAPPSACVYDDSTPETDRQIYARMVECIDIQVGRLLNSIDDLDDTLIIFVADNGTLTELAEDVFDDGRGKSTLYESGVRVPLIVADGRTWLRAQAGFKPDSDWANSPTFVADPGIEIADPTHIVDLFATMADAARIEAPSAVDSTSLMPLLEGVDGEIPPYAYAELYGVDGTGSAAIRQGAYKLMVNVRATDGGLCRAGYQLYDLVNDRFEQRDLVADEPEELAALTATLDALVASEPGSWLDVADCSGGS